MSSGRLICAECEAVFRDDEVVGVREPHGEMLGTCPDCGSYDIDDAYECDECGAEGELAEGYDTCEECTEAMLEEVEADRRCDQMRDDRLTGDR